MRVDVALLVAILAAVCQEPGLWPVVWGGAQTESLHPGNPAPTEAGTRQALSEYQGAVRRLQARGR